MPALVRPDPRYHRSFVAAVGEEPDQVYRYRDSEVELHDAERFAGYVAVLLGDADPDSPRPPGYEADTTKWWVEGETYLGRASVRHELTDALRTVGGHIGYWIRPCVRGRLSILEAGR